MTNIPRPTLSGPDIRIEDFINASQKFTYKTPPWVLLWNSIRCIAWHIWSEKNKRLKKHTLKPAETLSMAITRDIGFSFKSEDFRKACYSQ